MQEEKFVKILIDNKGGKMRKEDILVQMIIRLQLSLQVNICLQMDM